VLHADGALTSRLFSALAGAMKLSSPVCTIRSITAAWIIIDRSVARGPARRHFASLACWLDENPDEMDLSSLKYVLRHVADKRSIDS
jgi:hypothetical protein